MLKKVKENETAKADLTWKLIRLFFGGAQIQNESANTAQLWSWYIPINDDEGDKVQERDS